MSRAATLSAPTMRTIRLHGALGDKYGRDFRLNVKSPLEAIRAIGLQFRDKGFIDDLNAGNFAILRGGLLVEQVDHLGISFGKTLDMDIIPALEGEGRGFGKILFGAAIVGLSFALAAPFAGGLGAGSLGLQAGIGGVSFGQIAGFGALIGLSGITQAISPSPRTDTSAFEKPDQRASSFFNSQVNPSQEGGVVPIGIGRLTIGGVPISAALQVAQVPLSDIFDDDISAESWHWMNGPADTRTSGNFEIIGYTIIVLEDEVYGDEGQNGAFESLFYRAAVVSSVVEIHDLATDEYRFQVSVDGSRPRDWFDIVTVLNNDATVEYLQLASATASFDVAQAFSYLGNPNPLPPRRLTSRWRWDRGAGVGFAMPATIPGDDSTLKRVRFDY